MFACEESGSCVTTTEVIITAGMMHGIVAKKSHLSLSVWQRCPLAARSAHAAGQQRPPTPFERVTQRRRRGSKKSPLMSLPFRRTNQRRERRRIGAIFDQWQSSFPLRLPATGTTAQKQPLRRKRLLWRLKCPMIELHP